MYDLPPSNFFMLWHHKKFQPSNSKRSKVIHEQSLPRDTHTHRQTDRRHPPSRIIVRHGIVNSVADKKSVKTKKMSFIKYTMVPISMLASFFLHALIIFFQWSSLVCSANSYAENAYTNFFFIRNLFIRKLGWRISKNKKKSKKQARLRKGNA